MFEIEQSIYAFLIWCDNHPVITIISALLIIAVVFSLYVILMGYIEARQERRNNLPSYIRAYDRNGNRINKR